MNKRKTIISTIVMLIALFLIVLIFFGKSPINNITKEQPIITEVEIEIIEEESEKIDKKLSPITTTEIQEEEGDSSESESESNGACPPLNANYRKNVGFAAYAKAMKRLGGDFYITGNSNQRLLRIDFSSQRLIPVSINRIKGKGYSSRTRVIGDEPALKLYINKVEKKYGISNPEVLLLIPQSLENKIATHLLNALKKHNLTFKDISGFRGEYHGSANRMVLHVSEAVKSRTGSRVNCGVKIYL